MSPALAPAQPPAPATKPPHGDGGTGCRDEGPDGDAVTGPRDESADGDAFAGADGAYPRGESTDGSDPRDESADGDAFAGADGAYPVARAPTAPTPATRAPTTPIPATAPALTPAARAPMAPSSATRAPTAPAPTGTPNPSSPDPLAPSTTPRDIQEKDKADEEHLIHTQLQEKDKADEEHKIHVAEYRAFLESCNFIKTSTHWRKVKERLEDDERCSRLQKTDRLDIFRDYIRDLTKQKDEQKKLQKEQGKQERKNRDGFCKMLEDHVADGTITAKTRWHDYRIKIKESQAYLAIAANTSGSTPKELFDDVIEDLDIQLSKDQEIESLRVQLAKAEILNAKLQKNLEEAHDLLRKHSMADKGIVDDANTFHDIPGLHSGAETCPDETRSCEEKNGSLKRKGGRSRIASRVARCHDIIVCENEVGAVQVLELVEGSEYEILQELEVPGVIPDPYDKDKPKIKLESLTPFGKILFLGMIDDLYRLHRAGLSLDGKIELEDFYWLKNKKVKLAADLKDRMLRRSPTRMNRDYKKLCKLMRKLLSKCSVEIPTDLKFLLYLMDSDNPWNEQILIRYNICLMDEISKGSYTVALYNRLKQLDAEDIETFGVGWENKQSYRSATVYDYIIAAGDDDWSNNMCENMFIKLIHGRWGRDSGLGPPQEEEKLVKLMCHCIVHLPELAYHDGKIRFTDANVPSMIELATPGLFSQFQAGMYAIKQFAFPHLMRVMRV